MGMMAKDKAKSMGNMRGGEAETSGSAAGTMEQQMKQMQQQMQQMMQMQTLQMKMKEMRE
jgi:hypothetical protein